MTDPMLRADCAECAALCCTLLAFDKGDSFAFDKKAGTPCHHLGQNHQCTIHADLAQKGFQGCIRFDCHGAGQRVTQEVFDGRSWRDDPALIAPMADAFRAMRKVHELLLLLHTARKLSLTDVQIEQLDKLVAQLTPNGKWTAQDLAAFDGKTVDKDVRTFLGSLRDQMGAFKIT